MAKQPLDLYKLFKLVVERGGLVEVSVVVSYILRVILEGSAPIYNIYRRLDTIGGLLAMSVQLTKLHCLQQLIRYCVPLRSPF